MLHFGGKVTTRKTRSLPPWSFYPSKNLIIDSQGKSLIEQRSHLVTSWNALFNRGDVVSVPSGFKFDGRAISNGSNNLK